MYVHKMTFKRMFIATVFIIIKASNIPSVTIKRRMDKLWYFHTMKYYSSVKSNNIDTYSNMDASPKHYTTERNLMQKRTDYMLSFM